MYLSRRCAVFATFIAGLVLCVDIMLLLYVSRVLYLELNGAILMAEELSNFISGRAGFSRV